MISLCILTRNDQHIDNIISLFHASTNHFNLKYEVCIGDNSTDPVLIQRNKHLADEYITISDKELFRMGIPWAHNRIIAQANSYKIFYVDADEYPIWVNPKLEEIYEESFVPTTMRADFFSFDEIIKINKKIAKDRNLEFLKKKVEDKDISRQARLCNSRYIKFEGICHSIFYCPEDKNSKEIAAILLHSKDRRQKAANKIIKEQFIRQNHNPMLTSSEKVLGWGKKYGKEHQYKDWIDFVKNAR